MPNLGAHLDDDDEHPYRKGEETIPPARLVSSDELTTEEYDQLVECECQLRHYHPTTETAVMLLPAHNGIKDLTVTFDDLLGTLFVTVEPFLSGYGVINQQPRNSTLVVFGASLADALKRFGDHVHRRFADGFTTWWSSSDDDWQTPEGRGF